jgi:carboxyl-terminal processing protease
VTISQRDDQVFIVSPIEGTPAFEVGLQSGDVIRGINGETQDTWDLDVVVSQVRGPEGTMVTLDVEREDVDGTLSFEITRGRITFPNLNTLMIGDDVGYMRLGSFNEKAASDIATALDDLADQGAEGYILDLRDNPGGLLSASIDVSSLFIEDGIIVRVEERDGPEIQHRARGRVKTDAPLVVLVNEYSASASEIVAGALQDYARADLVGTKSFGKGSVQTVEDLSFGGGVKFTIAHYLTPKSRVIDGVGVTPEHVVEMDPMLQVEEADDIQLEKAVEVLRGQL